MNSSKTILLILISFGYENLKAAENFTKFTFCEEFLVSNTRSISKESKLLNGLCFDCTKEDEADLKEFSSQLVLDYKPCAKNCTYQYYSPLKRYVSSGRIGDLVDQFKAFRAAKNAERSMIAAKENLKRVKVALHYDNLNKVMQQSLDLN